MTKKEELLKLRERLNIEIIGKENYYNDAPSIMISNHNRLMDIFYVPMSIDDYVVSLISARLVYKQDIKRLEMVNRYLNAFPIEAHGGNLYAKMCLSCASSIVQNNISVSIFPEGAYLPGDDLVYRGRTGAARILFNVLDNNKFAYFLPVAIDVNSEDELDSYTPNEKDEIVVKILEPIDVNKFYSDYKNSLSKEEKNKIFHRITDIGMQNISSALNREYIPEYIELFPKKNVIFKGGEVFDTKTAQSSHYVERYNNELSSLQRRLIKHSKQGV